MFPLLIAVAVSSFLLYDFGWETLLCVASTTLRLLLLRNQKHRPRTCILQVAHHLSVCFLQDDHDEFPQTSSNPFCSRSSSFGVSLEVHHIGCDLSVYQVGKGSFSSKGDVGRNLEYSLGSVVVVIAVVVDVPSDAIAVAVVVAAVVAKQGSQHCWDYLLRKAGSAH